MFIYPVALCQQQYYVYNLLSLFFVSIYYLIFFLHLLVILVAKNTNACNTLYAIHSYLQNYTK